MKEQMASNEKQPSLKTPFKLISLRRSHMRAHGHKLSMKEHEKSDITVPYIEVDDQLQYAWRLARAAEILQAVRIPIGLNSS